MKIKAALVALAALLPFNLSAQEWPGGAVEVVVPYAPGGAADVMGRVFMDAIGNKLGHTFVIKNTAGAGGLLAARQVARVAPDGRTLIISGAASHLLAPLMNKDANMDPVKEFTHIAYFGGAPSVLVVHPSTGVKSMKDFLAYVRGQKESVGYVSPGVGTGGHITAAYLADKEKLNLVHVPHKGGGTAILDVVAGHVKVASMNWSTAREHVAAGSLNAIAITSSKRIPDQPNLPTFAELGLTELVMATWYGLSGPAGLPANVVATLNKAAIDSLNDPRVKRQLELEAAEPKALSPAEFTAFIAEEVKRWSPTTERLRNATP
jgi:tripartite-type tricarboxylate transporter receptor subunit TctC